MQWGMQASENLFGFESSQPNEASLGLFEKLGFVRECYAESIESFVFTLEG